TLLGERHDAVGVRERERTPQGRVDDAEDGRVGADAERERDEGDGRESRFAAEHPRAEDEILDEGIPRGGCPRRLVANRRKSALATEALPGERRRDLQRAPPQAGAGGRAAGSRRGIFLEQIAGDRLARVGGNGPREQTVDAAWQARGHMFSSSSSTPRHICRSARRLSRNA